ncbi:hypothetical protein NKG05_22200 [Oerskovia sp. M15]
MPTAPPTTPHDPYLWLEEVDGREAMTWVQGRNAETAATIEATTEFAATEQAIREVLDSDDKIPDVSKIGEHYYNFWRDAQHERGIWRRTTLDSYRTDHPRGSSCSTSTRWARPRAELGLARRERAAPRARPGVAPRPDRPVARRLRRRRHARVRPRDQDLRRTRGRRVPARGVQGRARLDRRRHGLRLHGLRSGSMTPSGYPGSSSAGAAGRPSPTRPSSTRASPRTCTSSPGARTPRLRARLRGPLDRFLRQRDVPGPGRGHARRAARPDRRPAFGRGRCQARVDARRAARRLGGRRHYLPGRSLLAARFEDFLAGLVASRSCSSPRRPPRWPARPGPGSTSWSTSWRTSRTACTS